MNSAPDWPGGFVLFDPVDGDEGDEGMGGAEINEEQAARWAEVDDAAVEGEVTVVV